VVDLLAILVVGVASFAIVINAVFLHFDRRIYEPEQLSAKLQRTQQSLKVEGDRRSKVTAFSTKSTVRLPGIEIMWTRSDGAAIDGRRCQPSVLRSNICETINDLHKFFAFLIRTPFNSMAQNRCGAT